MYGNLIFIKYRVIKYFLIAHYLGAQYTREGGEGYKWAAIHIDRVDRERGGGYEWAAIHVDEKPITIN